MPALARDGEPAAQTPACPTSACSRAACRRGSTAATRPSRAPAANARRRGDGRGRERVAPASGPARAVAGCSCTPGTQAGDPRLRARTSATTACCPTPSPPIAGGRAAGARDRDRASRCCCPVTQRRRGAERAHAGGVRGRDGAGEAARHRPGLRLFWHRFGAKGLLGQGGAERRAGYPSGWIAWTSRPRPETTRAAAPPSAQPALMPRARLRSTRSRARRGMLLYGLPASESSARARERGAGALAVAAHHKADEILVVMRDRAAARRHIDGKLIVTDFSLRVRTCSRARARPARRPWPRCSAASSTAWRCRCRAKPASRSASACSCSCTARRGAAICAWSACRRASSRSSRRPNGTTIGAPSPVRARAALMDPGAGGRIREKRGRRRARKAGAATLAAGSHREDLASQRL